MSSEEKQKKWNIVRVGGYKEYKPPVLKNVAYRVQSQFTNTGAQPVNELNRVGNYSVMRMSPQGDKIFQPLAIANDFLLKDDPRRLVGNYFEDSRRYYVCLQGGHLQEFTNFKGRISFEEIRFDAVGNVSKKYVVALEDDEGHKYEIGVPVDDWRLLYDYIEKHAPLCQVYGDVINNHREKFKRIAGLWIKGNFPKKYIADFWGWGPLINNVRKFYHGGCEDCSSEKMFPELLPGTALGRCMVFAMEQILFAGPMEVTAPLMLYSLASYLDAPFTDAGFPLSHCIMLVGESGYLKTSFAREIFSPFVPYHKRIFSVRGTAASMNVLHGMAFDDTLVIDDFNHEGSQAEVRAKMKNIQGLIRGYSDKTPRAKYGGMDNIKQYPLRGGCVFTGETKMTGQLKSGELRYLRINLHAPFEKDIVSALHNNSFLVPQFYASFINWVECNYCLIVEYVKKKFEERRARWDIPEPRMKDAAIHLTIVADLLSKLVDCNPVCGYANAYEWNKCVTGIVYNLAFQQSCEAQKGEPYLRYLKEVWNLIGTGEIRLAGCLEMYVENMSSFIGYKENDLLIVKKDALFRLVNEAFFARNEYLPIGVDEVSKKLKEAGVTKCDNNSCLIKSSAKIPGRPRMLALIIKKCIEKIDGVD